MNVEHAIRDVLQFGSLNKTIFCSEDVREEVERIADGVYGRSFPIVVPESWRYAGHTETIVGWDHEQQAPDLPRS